MKALMSHEPGSPETLQITELESPVPGQGEVRIKVAACGVNYPDALIIEDKYQFRPQRPFAPGGEVVGEIDGEIVGEMDGEVVGEMVGKVCWKNGW